MKKEKQKKSLESTLWNACNKLRGSMTATDYMYFTMGLVFLKIVDLKFEKRRNELLNSDDKDLVEIPSFYLEKNVFFIPEKARYSYIVKNSKANNIGIIVDEAFELIEKENASLKGALPKIYAEGVRIITPTKFSSLIDVINDIEEDEEHPMVDIIGKIYQYFLNKFSVLARHEKGEFYTPDPIVDLITTLIEPFSGKIYDIYTTRLIQWDKRECLKKSA